MDVCDNRKSILSHRVSLLRAVPSWQEPRCLGFRGTYLPSDNPFHVPHPSIAPSLATFQHGLRYCSACGLHKANPSQYVVTEMYHILVYHPTSILPYIPSVLRIRNGVRDESDLPLSQCTISIHIRSPSKEVHDLPDGSSNGFTGSL
jgi:hypothetical protein